MVPLASCCLRKKGIIHVLLALWIPVGLDVMEGVRVPHQDMGAKPCLRLLRDLGGEAMLVFAVGWQAWGHTGSSPWDAGPEPPAMSAMGCGV